jgi:hypothetical protein
MTGRRALPAALLLLAGCAATPPPRPAPVRSEALPAAEAAPRHPRRPAHRAAEALAPGLDRLLGALRALRDAAEIPGR